MYAEKEKKIKMELSVSQQFRKVARHYAINAVVKAVEILVKDLKVFSSFNEDLFKEITQLLTLDNFRYMHRIHC